MDLQTARKTALAQSKKSNVTVYVNLNSKMECEVSTVSDSDKENIMAAFEYGKELPINDEPKTTKTNAALAKLSNSSRAKNVSNSKMDDQAVSIKVISKSKIKPGLTEAPDQSAKELKNKVMSKKTEVKKSGKAATEKTKPAKVKGGNVPRGNNMMLTEAQWKKVDAKVGEGSWSGWVRDLVKKAAGIND